MPFTPFPFGPGMLFKAAGGRRFSLIGFGLAQVLMDIEPGIGMLRGADVLHGWSHGVPGALAIGAVASALTPPLARRLLPRWNAELRHLRLARYAGEPAPGWGAAAAGAFVGTLSHIVFDSIMHVDMRPFAPWSAANPFLHWLPVDTLHQACVASGVLGLTWWLLRARAAPAGA